MDSSVNVGTPSDALDLVAGREKPSTLGPPQAGDIQTLASERSVDEPQDYSTLDGQVVQRREDNDITDPLASQQDISVGMASKVDGVADQRIVDGKLHVVTVEDSPPTSPPESRELMIVEVEPIEMDGGVKENEDHVETTTVLSTRVADTARDELAIKGEVREDEEDESSDSEIGGEDVEIIVEGEEQSDSEDGTHSNTREEREQSDMSVHEGGGDAEVDAASIALRAKQSARVKQFFTTLQKFGNNMSRDGADQVQELISALLVSLTV